MDEILIEGRVYVSSKQAAKITGYAKDYVGQLCREGRVEARLVGRNWYVLESSIREHRFGKPGEQDSSESPVEAAPQVLDRVSAWQAPLYEAEVPSFVPELAPKPASSVSTPAIVDMQSAWKEWFEDKKPLQAALPDGVADFKDEYLPIVQPEEPVYAPEAAAEEPVMISRVQPETAAYAPVEEQEEEVELHRSYASRETGERIPASSGQVVDLTRRTSEKGRKEARVHESRASGSGALRAMFLVVAIAAALIALVGTGNADRLLAGTSFDFGAQKSIVDFLGGKSTYDNSL